MRNRNFRLSPSAGGNTREMRKIPNDQYNMGSLLLDYCPRNAIAQCLALSWDDAFRL